MDVLVIILRIVFAVLSIILSAVVLLQEGKDAGLSGAVSGAAESYWGKNKGRSMEGKLELATKIVAIVFFILAIVLNILA